MVDPEKRAPILDSEQSSHSFQPPVESWPFWNAVDQLGVGIAEVTLEGQWLRANQRLCEMLGHSETELLRTRPEQFFPFPDLSPDGYQRHQVLAGEGWTSMIEHSVVRAQGTPVLLRAVLSAVPDQQTKEVRRLLFVTEETASKKQSDQEQREFGQRLITMQETERSRIARDLHDDIGQSLAILAIQLDRAGRPVSDRPGKKHASVPELSQKVREVALRVGQLSRQLHSYKLEYLGLAKAVRGECKEFSEQRGITVDCDCDGVPQEVDKAIGLCLLRVVQEALHNIGKHSRATMGKVELTANADELRLTISDNGVGFDLEQARLANGIGLISMRERLQLAGGDCRISSKPGEGTLITARVALPGSQDVSAQ